MTERRDGLPRFARIRVEQAMPRGRVEIIQVRPRRLSPTVEVDAWDLQSDADHGRSSERAATLFQHEHLSVIENLLGRPIEFSQTRRNLCVRGFNLEVARGAVLEVGETLLQVTGRCHPCARMEEALGSGGFAAMFGHGGWTASIVQTGTIRLGDVVQLHSAGDALAEV
jgi:MOSC domain-containing protein YiiM